MEITRPLLELLTLQEGLIRRSQLLEGPLRIASPARAVVDAARQARSEARTRALVLETVQRGIVRRPDLRHDLEAGSVRGSARARRALAEAETGVWSVPESDLGVLARVERTYLTLRGRRRPSVLTGRRGGHPGHLTEAG